MRHLFKPILVIATFALVSSACAQSAATPQVPAPAGAAAAVPVPMGKRMACETAAQAMTGQDRKDQMQLCMAQARLDCLKQAIDQKIVEQQRRDFVRSCAE